MLLAVPEPVEGDDSDEEENTDGKIAVFSPTGSKLY